MKTKIFILSLIICVSFVSPQAQEIPFKYGRGKVPGIEIGIDGKSEIFTLSLNSPISFLFYHDGDYDINSKKKIKENLKINYPPLINERSGDLIEEKIKLLKNVDNIEVDQMPLFAVKNINEDAHILSLAPKVNENSIGILDLLKNKGKIKNKQFSIQINETVGGLFNGNLYLGDKHNDFRTSQGDTITCKNEYTDSWGCKFQNISYNNTSVNFKDDKIILVSDLTNAIFNYKYKEDFLKMFPKEAECKEEVQTDEETFSYIKCSKWSITELEINLGVEDHQLKMKVPDMRKVNGISKLHYTYNPSFIFTKEYEGVYLPIFWFKGYHILFSKGDKDTDPTAITFQTFIDELLTTKNERAEEKKKEGYLTISKTAFVFLCICLGIVFVFLILLIGYVRLTSNKPTRGLKSKNTSGKKGGSRMPTFDSALLGTSDENMPKRLKTSL